MAAVAGAEDHLTTGIEHIRIVRRKKDGEGPREAMREITRADVAAIRFGPYIDKLDLSTAHVCALQRTLPTRRRTHSADIDDVGVFGVDGDKAAFSRPCDAAVAPGHHTAAGVVGHVEARIILLGAVDAVGKRIVNKNTVELRRELVVDGAKRFTGVEADASAAVVALNHAPIVSAIDPEAVVVTVGRSHLAEALAAVSRLPHTQIKHIDGLGILRIGEDVHVIPGALAQIGLIAEQLPGVAEVVGSVEARFIGVFGLDQRPHTPRLHGGCRDADLAQHFGFGQPFGLRDVRPRVTAVTGFPQPAFGAATVQCPEATIHLPDARVEDAGVLLVEGQVHSTGFVTHKKDVLPGRSTIHRFIDTPFRVGAESMAQRGDVDDIGVARMNADLADVTGVGQAAVSPRLAAVAGLVDAVTVADVGADGRFAHAHVDHVGVRRRHGDIAHRRTLEVAVGNVDPRRTGVGGLPQSTRHGAEVEGGLVGRMTGHRDHTAAA